MTIELTKPDFNTLQSLAIDPGQVQQLIANNTQEEGVQKAAEQFEAIFLQLVLKNMHAATEAVSSQNGFFASKEQQQFRDMYDAQTAQELAANNQLGLAEAIVRQFSEKFTPVENKFKEMAQVVAEHSKEVNEIEAAPAPVERLSGPAFAQSLNIIPIR
ncbi:rod-binding protein [Pseudoalteromonas sp. L21]|uniref:rod-binding protein n=1 Tax=Pseudoalteromonas sp. L21 TaxID=1539746 RepID=UPI001F23ACBD|nr:rod-binding protein [Pseudoalteromonas sp. L21]